ncbi:MAG: hypoxanthine phosphoribosyltransferase [Candidatus Altiarchaeales archaeon]|nr:hypoxanthine phosphoribosyltransferase [Candidatus Altiarchaeales archaeon]
MILETYTKGLQTLIAEEEIKTRCEILGKEITEHYKGKDLVVIGFLKGVFPFFADLVRHIGLPIRCDFIGVSSYGSRTATSGVVRLTSDITQPVNNCEILIVEDIVDTGLTMKYLLDTMKMKGAASVEICSLLSKPSRRKVPVTIHFPGFEVDDHFVVGYGMDWGERLRNLRYIGYYPEGPPELE